MRCDREHKKAEFTQQSRQPLGANGFALSPIRAVFLDGSRWAVEPAMKVRRCCLWVASPSVLTLPFREKEDGQSDQESYGLYDGFFAARLWKTRRVLTWDR